MKHPRLVDGVLLALAFVLGLAHLHYPFGREHALAAYVGVEWLRGSAPYAQLQNQEGPGLLLVHGVLGIFDGRALDFRVLCLLGTLALGWLAPTVVRDEGEEVRAGARGISAFGSSLVAHGFFDFWHAGRGGQLAMLAWLLAVALLRRGTRPIAAIAAGILAGLGIALLPTSFPFLALIGYVLWSGRAAWRRWLMVVLGFAAAVLFFVAAMGPSGTRGAYELLVSARCLYFGRDYVEMPGLRVTEHFVPVAAPVLGAFALAWGLSARERRLGSGHRVVVGWAACTYATLWIPSSFAIHENEVWVALAALVLARIGLDAHVLFGARAPRAIASFALLLGTLFWTSSAGAPNLFVARYRAYLQGKDRPETFDVPEIAFLSDEIHEVALEIRRLTAPHERVAIRGYEPELYLAARRRYGGRFFWTGHLQWEGCAYAREAWTERDQRDLDYYRPALVVAFANDSGVDSYVPFVQSGYRIESRISRYVLLRRP